MIQKVIKVLSSKNSSGFETISNELDYLNIIYNNLWAGIPDSSSASLSLVTSEVCLPVSWQISISLTTFLSSVIVLDSDSNSILALIKAISSLLLGSLSSKGPLSLGFLAVTQFTMSIIYTTSVSIIISCALIVENCLSYSMILTIVTIDILTMICLVTASPISGQNSGFVM